MAIVTLVRDGESDRAAPARVNYRRIRGTAEAKLEALRAIGAAADPFAGEWTPSPAGWLDPLIPPTGDAAWEDMPLITDLFPWQQPGCKFGRTWPIAPSRKLLADRWRRLVAAMRNEKAALFYTGNFGRTVSTTVGRAKPLVETTADEPLPKLSDYGFRSFDRQFAIKDPRVANLERPALWASVSSRQIFLFSLMTGRISAGPGMAASVGVPDLHAFRGSFGGKDIIPLYRDAAANEPNLTSGLSTTLALLLGIDPPLPEDIASYCYALLSPTAYQQRFAAALETPGLRVPITADAELWAEAARAGRELLWLHTYAERFVDPAEGRPARVPAVPGIGWDREVNRIPEDSSQIAYDPESGTITIGDGRVGGVRPEVWAFSVSGMQVVPKWLGYRTRRGAGRAVSSTSELDRIRPTEWADEWNDELLDLLRILTLTVDKQAGLADLLERVCEGDLISAADLPDPVEAERRPPPSR